MKRVTDLFAQIYSFDNLYAAYIAARKGKRYRGEVLRFTANLEENLIQLQNELIYETYQVGRYREFYVTEPKRRLVMALPFRDRVVQWAIYRVLNPIFEKTFIHHSYACRVGKGTHAAAAKLYSWLRTITRKPEKWYYLKLDVAKYFYRVDHAVIMRIISRKIKDKDLLRLLKKIINSENTKFGLPTGGTLDTDKRISDKGMPIGNLTSQMFANIYLNELDQYVKHVLRIKHYIRYMDDIIILHPSKQHLHQVKFDISRYLNEQLRLELNNKTTIRPVSLGVHFVGQQIWGTHRKIRKPASLKIKRRLALLARQYNRGELPLAKFKASLASYLGIMKHVDCYRFKAKLLSTIKLCRNHEE